MPSAQLSLKARYVSGKQVVWMAMFESKDITSWRIFSQISIGALSGESEDMMLAIVGIKPECGTDFHLNGGDRDEDTLMVLMSGSNGRVLVKLNIR
jgi:hypothetical protein